MGGARTLSPLPPASCSWLRPGGGHWWWRPSGEWPEAVWGGQGCPLGWTCPVGLPPWDGGTGQHPG